MEPVHVQCMQKNSQTSQNHAIARHDTVCSYFFQLAATAIKTVFCDCAKQSY